MIARIWHGWTSPQNADAYETLLRTEIFSGILARNVTGFLRIELMRAPVEEEIEFVTVMWFDSLDSVRAFAGVDYEAAVVLPKARALLKRFDARSRHYEVREQRVAR
jgi:heme-degrading monooxygenase HmoA